MPDVAETAATKILKHNAHERVPAEILTHRTHTFAQPFKRSLWLSLNGRAETDHTGHRSLKNVPLVQWVLHIQAKSAIRKVSSNLS